MKVLFLILFCSYAFAGTEYQIMWDIDFSPYSGGEDLIMAHHLLSKGEDKMINRPPAIKSVKHGFCRFFDLLMWNIIDSYLMIFQHEIFGHGYRIRDLGHKYAKVTRYKFSWDGAETHYAITERLTSSQETAIAIGGVEATAIMANRIRLKWLHPRKMEARESILYINSQHDITDYIQSLKDYTAPTPEGHDISGYLFFLNATYNESHLSKHDLRNRVLINYLDPFTWFSVYSQIKFIVNGKPFRIPMISIGDYKYLPSIRLGLTPFGPEYFLENFLRTKDKKGVYFYLKFGSHSHNNYYGLGIECPFLFTWQGLKIGGRLDGWREPKVLFKAGALQAWQIEDADTIPPLYSSKTLHKKLVGLALSLIAEKQIKKSNSYFYIQPGFKTKGFLPGEALRASPILRLGLSFNF